MRATLIAAALASTSWATASVFDALQQLPLSILYPDSSSTDDSEPPPYRDELVNLHRSLVEIPSISGKETEVADFLLNYLDGKGYMVYLQPVPPRDNTPEGQDRYNVLAWRGEKHQLPSENVRLLMTTHIDVVPPYIPYSIDHNGWHNNKNTMIRGRGTVDAKGSLAAMLIALEGLLAAGEVDDRDAMLAFVVGEEVNGEGMRVFSESLDNAPDGGPHFKSAIFGEPTEGRLACGHKGGMSCVVKAQGIAGHSGYPWLGKSANEVMVRAMARLIDADLGSSEEFGNTTVNIGTFNGGVAQNVIAEEATVQIMVRVAIGPEKGGAEIVEKKVTDILKDIDDEALTMTCSPGYGFVEANCDVDGFDPIVVNYGTDIPHLHGNHTRYLYGPGNILVAHGKRENLTLGDLEQAVEDYQKLILHALK